MIKRGLGLENPFFRCAEELFIKPSSQWNVCA